MACKAIQGLISFAVIDIDFRVTQFSGFQWLVGNGGKFIFNVRFVNMHFDAQNFKWHYIISHTCFTNID